MNPGRTSGLVRRLAAALMLSSAPFVVIERAVAACDPPTSAASPANNGTVTCSGTDVNQNTSGPANFGYGTGNETGITVNVQSGASVTGTPGQFPLQTSGIFVGDGTVNNLGTVTVSTSHGVGIFGLNSITVNNSGAINADANGQHGDHGVLGNGNVNVTNFATGTIFGFAGGITGGDDVNVINTGKIEQGAISGFGAAIGAGGNATVTNAVDGSSIGQISGDAFGIRATNANVTNSGVILAGN